jgi:xanthine dehydrogenase accessory factor
VSLITQFSTHLALQPAVLVTIDATEGSAPRDRGAWMAVFSDRIIGTIGGGHLEFKAIARARESLLSERGTMPPVPMRVALGPSLGQCCGGVVHLRFEAVAAADIPFLRERLAPGGSPVALFGGGHVGKALVRLLGSLPFQVHWIDSRDEIFPDDLPANVRCEHSAPVHAAVDSMAPASLVLIMSFSHAEDLDVLAACLKRQRERGDLPYIGLIGSKSKWATFRHRLEARGFHADELGHVTCPIGVPGIDGKEPEVIAVAVAAQLLRTDSQG